MGGTESDDGSMVGVLVGVLCALICVILIGVVVFCGVKRQREAKEEKGRTDAFSIRMDGHTVGAKERTGAHPNSPHMQLPSVSTASFMNGRPSSSMMKVSSMSSVDESGFSGHDAFASQSFAGANSMS